MDTEEGSGEITRKAPTPEHEGSAALGQNEGFGETQKEAPTPEPSVSKVPSKVRMDMIEQQVVQRNQKGGRWLGHFLWNPTLLWDILCEVNPQAITSRKQKVWNVKLHPPQSPLSISWLGEAKTA